VSVVIGGPMEMVPIGAIQSNIPTIASVKPYSPLELEGRDIYIREGCYNCHSQMVRPFRDEVIRYGEYSKAGEFIYDHPFQFGSKRMGPDLHRVGGKYPNMWHYRHMADPTSTSPGSIMPKYSWLHRYELDTSYTKAKLEVMSMMGVPYSAAEIAGAEAAAKAQAETIAADLRAQDNTMDPSLASKEIIAIIAYMQRLGTDIKAAPAAAAGGAQ
ncbi:MAG: cytochrome-c oxidase, cbb3-type subunit II, partial [Deltaproteobacteria bacterium]|nr:cytochrome-c oxidase, cbb3-type subunit II [Deltaproteobacteria bacterium]